MTTTAFDDQFTPSTQTIEIVHAPYEPVAILKRNVAELELALKQQTERAEKTEEKLTTARDDMQSWIDSRNGWMERAGAAEAELAKLREQKPVAWIRTEHGGTGERTVSFKGRPNITSIRDEVINPVFTPLYAAPVPASAAPAIDRAFASYCEDRAVLNGAPGELKDTTPAVQLVDGSDDYYDYLGALVEQHPAGVMRRNTDDKAPDVPAYLLERQENGLSWYISAVTSRGSAWHWTADVNAAIRFSRKDDAIACWNIIARHHVGIGGSGTTETTPKQHIFEDARALLQSAEVHHD